MEIKPIRSESDHHEALLEIERLWGSPPGTAEGDRLDILLALVETWENRHHPIDLPDPIDAIRFRLEQQGLDTKALVGVIGSRSRVFEVMNRQRNLTLPMIRALHERFGIPADVLIMPTKQAG